MLLPDSMGTQSQDYAYAIRMNHTYLPSNKQVLNAFDIQPDQAYQLYWFFANLQLAIDRYVASAKSLIVLIWHVTVMYHPSACILLSI